jgi:hypothetical protein
MSYARLATTSISSVDKLRLPSWSTSTAIPVVDDLGAAELTRHGAGQPEPDRATRRIASQDGAGVVIGWGVHLR